MELLPRQPRIFKVQRFQEEKNYGRFL